MDFSKVTKTSTPTSFCLRITIPKNVRIHMGMEQGNLIAWKIEDNKVIISKAE